MLLILIIFLSPLLTSAYLNRNLPFFKHNNQRVLSSKQHPSVAIIGAGAAGSSAAYHLANYSSNNVNIEIFESSSFIGGRAQAIELDGVVLETGASIYSDLNSILVEAVREFNLTTRSDLSDIDDDFTDDISLGVWDGNSFVFELKNGGTLSTYWQFLRRFGWKAPYYSNKLNKDAITRFLKLYDDEFPWKNLGETAKSVGLEAYLNTSAETLLSNYGIDPDYSNTFIQSLTRVNYAIDLSDIHSLAAFVCLTAAKDGVKAVEGGNWKIFDGMVNKSRAEIHLNQTIESLVFDQKSNKWFVDDRDFDYVILAAPLHLSGISIYPEVIVPVIEYVDLYSIHVLTDKPLDASSEFNSSKSYGSIVTIPSNNSETHVPYTSISHLAITENGYHVYKIFSYRDLSAADLSSLFGNIKILQTDAKRWFSYPKMVPYNQTVQFPDTQLATGLYYTSLIEPLISTMETSALSGKNAAKLIWDEIREGKLWRT